MITQKNISWAIGLAVMLVLPLLIQSAFPAADRYYLHLVIQILIWAFIYTGWSMMGRFGLTSLGHGAFTGIGAYVTVLLWNFAGITPWIGIPVAMLVATIAGVLVGYPCFRLRITGRAADAGIHRIHPAVHRRPA
jgi:branched-chain amino acid transport system permease protein